MKNAVHLFGNFFFVTHKKVAVVSSSISLNARRSRHGQERKLFGSKKSKQFFFIALFC